MIDKQLQTAVAKSKLSHCQIAKLAKVSQPSVSKIAKGGIIQLDIAAKIAKVLKLRLIKG